MLSPQETKDITNLIVRILKSRIAQKKTNDTPLERFDMVNKGYVDQSITSGIVAPTSTPKKVGYIYVDTTHTKVYIATGTSSSSDWTVVN